MPNPFRRCAPFVLPSLLLLGACGGDDEDPPGTPPPKAASTFAAVSGPGAKEANELYQSLCFTCHGSSGHGDGPGAGALNPKPRSFADVAWQDSVTDEAIGKAITYGGAAVGKSPMMPAQPQLKSQPEVLAALVQIVRSFRGK